MEICFGILKSLLKMFDRLPEAVGAMGVYRFCFQDGVRPLLCVRERDLSSLLMIVVTESNTLGKNM